MSFLVSLNEDTPSEKITRLPMTTAGLLTIPQETILEPHLSYIKVETPLFFSTFFIIFTAITLCVYTCICEYNVINTNAY